MFSRIKTTIGRHPVITMIAFMAIIMAVIILKAQGSPNTTVLVKVSVADQLTVIASTPNLATLSSDENHSKLGWLPVSVLSSSQYMDLISNSPRIPLAVINPDLRITSSQIQDETGKTSLYATYFLSSQSSELLKYYELGSAQVNITPPVQSAFPQVRYSSSRYNGQPMGYNASTGSNNGFKYFLLFFAMSALLIIGLRARHRRLNRRTATKAMSAVEIPTTRFTDIAGCDEAIEEMQEIVMFLKDPEYFTRVGAKCPKGALLNGPPGTGKTLLARAIAGEAGVSFHPVSASEFEERYVGVGAERVRKLFADARLSPEGAIIFIDEIDAIGTSRTGGGDGAAAAHAQTLNQLLTEMDGFRQTDKLIVIAATNRADILDSALIRPGRFDKKIYVGIPDRLGREKILGVHSRGKPIGEDVDLGAIARGSSGMSGAELAQVVNEACMSTARDRRTTVTAKDFFAAIHTVAMGKERTSAIVTPQDREITAWHEAGHAVLGMILDDANNPNAVSIIPRGPAGGITWFDAGDEAFLTRKSALAQLCVGMGGRAGEELLLDGEYTSGPVGDLQASTKLALSMVMNYGMSGTGLMVKSENMINEATIEAVEKLLAEALVLARSTIASHRPLFDALVSNLLEHDTLVQSQLEELRNGNEVISPIMPSAPKISLKSDKPKVSTKAPPKEPPKDPEPPRKGVFDEVESRFPNPFRKKKKAVLDALLAIILATGDVAEIITSARKKKKAKDEFQE